MPANQVLVAVTAETAFFRLRGQATASQSTGFKNAAERLRSQGLASFVIDLTECQSMDSTFIGVLVGLSRRLCRAGGQVELINATDQVKRQLDDLFVLDQFRLTQCHLEPGTSYAPVQAVPPNKSDLCRLMLEAHQTLMDANPSNIPKFKLVSEFLEQDLQRLNG